MAFDTESHRGVADKAPEQTCGFVLNHTMLRVKDPDDDWIEIVEPGLLKELGAWPSAQAVRRVPERLLGNSVHLVATVGAARPAGRVGFRLARQNLEGFAHTLRCFHAGVERHLHPDRETAGAGRRSWGHSQEPPAQSARYRVEEGHGRAYSP